MYVTTETLINQRLKPYGYKYIDEMQFILYIFLISFFFSFIYFLYTYIYYLSVTKENIII